MIESCKKGSQSAQFEVYQLYYRAMFNTSLRIVQNSYEAEDVMQEAFLNAFTKLDSFKGEVAFGAWLKRIVINRSLTQLKKRSRLNETNLEVVDYKLEGDSAEEGMSELDLTHSKVQEVLRDIIASEGIGLLLQRASVIHADAGYSITAKVTDKLNQAAAE